MNQHWLAGQFPALMAQPAGIYGISYDIFTRPTEDPVPNGWESHRSKTYRELIRRLRADGFFHHQYSDHRHMNTTAWDAYVTMVNLVVIRPPNKLSTTVKGLKLHHISDMNLMDVTNEVMLGGNAAERLVGPAPRVLVHRLVGAGHHLTHVPQPVPQGHPGVPPRFTAPSPAAMNVANYLM
ncbi:hypothetical protein LXA43DRAFT_888760 [Ganoderma leucocontextum]|nr:hypothetical protein LXA43DRAFT_888760 [Ganoderma leucocontextum]